MFRLLEGHYQPGLRGRSNDFGKFIAQLKSAASRLKNSLIFFSECVESSPHVLRRYCDRETCHPVTLLERIVRRNCKCENLAERVQHRDQQCCCPPPRYTTKCYDLYGVLSRIVYKYELLRGHCVTRKIVDEDKIGQSLAVHIVLYKHHVISLSFQQDGRVFLIKGL